MLPSTRKYVAEFFGTAALVILGCGSVAISGFGSAMPMGILPIALAFGLGVAGLIYGLGPISGAHINPAVSLAAWIAGRMSASDLPGYIAAQFLGGLAGAGLLVAILGGKLSGFDVVVSGLGQNGWGEGYLGGYGMGAAFIVEVTATFIFLVVILGSTSKNAATPLAGLAIGATLTVLIVTFIDVTGVSVNPARSLAPAVFVGGRALSQLWLFIAAPILGGTLAGLLFRLQVFETR